MSVSLHLLRLSDDGVQTLGRLEVRDGEGETSRVLYACHALERPWKGNGRRVSCIPPEPGGGRVEYRVAHRWSPKFKDHLDVIGEEPERSFVLVHSGNTYLHTVGCVLPGEGLADVSGDGRLDVTSSRVALDRLRGLVPKGGCPLTVYGVGYLESGETTAALLKAEAKANAAADLAADGVPGLAPFPPVPTPTTAPSSEDAVAVAAPQTRSAMPEAPRLVTHPAAGIVAKLKAQLWTALLPVVVTLLNLGAGALGLPAVTTETFESIEGAALWLVLALPMLLQWGVQWLTGYFKRPAATDVPVPVSVPEPAPNGH